MVASNRMRGPEWDERRKGGIGGSEAAAAIGLSPWKSRLQLYKEKTGEVEPEDISTKDYIHFGVLLEPVVVDEYVSRTNFQVVRPKKSYRSRKHAFMLANIDFRVKSDDLSLKIIGEAKTCGMFAYIAKEWGEDGTPIVPVEYYAQAQHNLVVTYAHQCDMPVLIGGQQFRLFRIPRDEEFIAKMIEEESIFWSCVTNKIEPPPTTASDLLLKFPHATPGYAKDANMKTARAYARWLRADTTIKLKEKIADKAKFEMQAFMGDAEELLFNGDTIATWRSGEKGRRFLAKRPKADKDDGPKPTKRPAEASAVLGLPVE